MIPIVHQADDRSGPRAPRFGVIALEALWPPLPSVKDRDNFKAVASQPVRNHVLRSRNHELTRAGQSAWTTKIRQLRQTLDGGEERHGDTARRVRVIARDVSTKVSQVADRSRRPDERHTRGAFRSRLRPHERSQVDTSL